MRPTLPEPSEASGHWVWARPPSKVTLTFSANARRSSTLDTCRGWSLWKLTLRLGKKAPVQGHPAALKGRARDSSLTAEVCSHECSCSGCDMGSRMFQKVLWSTGWYLLPQTNVLLV